MSQRKHILAASEASGVPAKSIRHYEKIGLVLPDRGSNGFRLFSDKDVQDLRLIRLARTLSIPFPQIRELLDLMSASASGDDDAREAALMELRAIQDALAELSRILKA
ncbi:MerR family transcriptional regulator [Roseococcus sp. YIM B11640]|uniref:MerR family transcriptional regulator n=1 Tax=Roseococcus sp. YIM B11640 TaxID=3133973 RepID=UPI003C79D7D6